MNDDPALLLLQHENWLWRPGAADVQGTRVSDPASFASELPPDLDDAATVGVVLGMLAETGALSDICREDADWIVAVEHSHGLRGYAANSLGEAAAWALLHVWDDTGLEAPVTDEHWS